MSILGAQYSATTVASIFAILLFVYVSSVVVYRVFFSPLSHIPGPKIAASTQLYEFYYNVIKKGQFIFKVEELHEAYGPIIRISPFEVHINDPDFHDIIYSGSERRDKSLWHTQWQPQRHSSQGTADHDHHRQRRAALSPFFSKRQIQKFSPFIQTRMDLLYYRLESEYKGTERILNLGDALSCYSTDVVTEFVFANNFNLLEYPDFISPLSRALSGFCNGTHLYMFFPWMSTMMRVLPRKFVELLDSGVRPFLELVDNTESQVKAVMESSQSIKSTKAIEQPTIFHEILFRSNLPPHEKTAERLNDEAITLISAGLETTKWTLSVAMFHLLENPEILQKLKKEILTVFPEIDSPPTWSALENLPYLSAVIQESLRLSYGATIRLPRESPDKPILYKEYVIPAGTPMSTSNYTMVHNERIFPNSHEFLPSRWIDSNGKITINGEKKSLSRYQTAFSKGSRICLGLNLAYAELYIALANLVRRTNFKLYETTIEDVECKFDLFVPKPKAESKGIRVQII